jgi:hypothetical protein
VIVVYGPVKGVLIGVAIGLLTITVPSVPPAGGSRVTVVRGKAGPTLVIVVYGPVNKGLLTITVPCVPPAAGGCVTVIKGKPSPTDVTVV